MLYATAGEISGRKKLQKIVYIAKKLSFPFKEKYQFHFYGPYSEELTLRIEELCEMGYLNEVREKRAGYYQYCYSITETGRDFLSMQEMDMPALPGLRIRYEWTKCTFSGVSLNSVIF